MTTLTFEGRLPGVRCNPALPATDQPIRLGIRERTQQHSADHAEDGGIGADPQPQGEDGNRGEPAAARPVAWQAARADFDQAGWTIAHAIDGNPATAWGIYPQVGKSHTAVFILKEPVPAKDGMRLVFSLEQQHGGGHLIGRPRLSATSGSVSSLQPLPPPGRYSNSHSRYASIG